MTQIKISPVLVKKVKRTFKGRATEVFKLMHSLKSNPNKGDLLASFRFIELRELKFDGVFRFYFFSNDKLVKLLDEDELHTTLIKFVEMSKKNNQDDVIDKLREQLQKRGFDWF